MFVDLGALENVNKPGLTSVTRTVRNDPRDGQNADLCFLAGRDVGAYTWSWYQEATKDSEEIQT